MEIINKHIIVYNVDSPDSMCGAIIAKKYFATVQTEVSLIEQAELIERLNSNLLNYDYNLMIFGLDISNKYIRKLYNNYLTNLIVFDNNILNYKSYDSLHVSGLYSINKSITANTYEFFIDRLNVCYPDNLPAPINNIDKAIIEKTTEAFKYLKTLNNINTIDKAETLINSASLTTTDIDALSNDDIEELLKTVDTEWCINNMESTTGLYNQIYNNRKAFLLCTSRNLSIDNIKTILNKIPNKDDYQNAIVINKFKNDYWYVCVYNLLTGAEEYNRITNLWLNDNNYTTADLTAANNKYNSSNPTSGEIRISKKEFNDLNNIRKLYTCFDAGNFINNKYIGVGTGKATYTLPIVDVEKTYNNVGYGYITNDKFITCLKNKTI